MLSAIKKYLIYQQILYLVTSKYKGGIDMKNIILSSIIFIISLITIGGQSNTKIEPSNKQSFYNYCLKQAQ
jgi:hypothetical protein